MTKRSYGYSDEGVSQADTPMPSTTTTTIVQAETWWRNLTAPQQKPYREKFVKTNMPTDDELITAFNEAHEPATADRSKAWWDGLSPAQRKAYRDEFANAPEDDELNSIYDSVHARDVGATKDASTKDGIVDGAPPVVAPATPGASATNPDLMPNGATFPEVPMYAGMPRSPQGTLPAREASVAR